MSEVIKFRANTIGPKIERIEVVSETAHYITTKSRFGGRDIREKKESDWGAICDSFDEAKQWLLDDAGKRVQAARRRLEAENSRLGNIKGMKEQA